MNSQEMIDLLDDNLAQYGETVRLVRYKPAPQNSVMQQQVTLFAVLRGYAPSDLVSGSGITQQDQKAILSPTQIIAENWPGTGVFVPKQGDRLITNRGLFTIQACAGIYVGDVLVRIEAQARGS